MADKLKPNFTPVPNVILDEIMRKLAPGAVKVLFAICRFTYGWGKQSDRISLSQLQAITGMARWSVVRSVKDLGDLVTITPGSASGRQASEYQLNVEIPDTDLGSISDQSHKVTSHLTSHRRVTFQRKPKKGDTGGRSKQKSPDDPEFEKAWSLYPERAGGNLKRKAYSAWRARIEDGEQPTEMIAGTERYAAYIRATGSEGTQYVKQAVTFFGPDRHYREAWTLPANNQRRSAGGFVV